MRRGKDDLKLLLAFGKGIGRRAQTQDLDTFVLVFIGDMDMTAQDAQHLFPDSRRGDDLPELVEVVGEELVQSVNADRFHVLVADDHGG